MDWSTTEKQRPRRKMPLAKAPRTSALANPKVLLAHGFLERLTAIKAMIRAVTSDNM